jgi:hypothetical protein
VKIGETALYEKAALAVDRDGPLLAGKWPAAHKTYSVCLGLPAPHFADPDDNIIDAEDDVVGVRSVALMAKARYGERDNIQLL